MKKMVDGNVSSICMILFMVNSIEFMCIYIKMIMMEMVLMVSVKFLNSCLLIYAFFMFELAVL